MKKTLLAIFSLALLLAVLPLLLIVVSQRQEIRKKAIGELTDVASLALSANISTINVGQAAQVEISLDTGGAAVDGVDIIVNFDPQVLTLTNITPDYSSNFQTFLPLVSGGNSFDAGGVVAGASGGQLEFGAATFDFNTQGLTPAVNGNGILLATLEFNGLAAGTSPVSFQFDPANRDITTDTNVVTHTAVLVDDILGSVGTVSISVSGAGPTLTPTPTTAPGCTGCGDPAPCSGGATCDNQGVCRALPRGGGDCDCDENCQGNLVCYQRPGPGGTDYCCAVGEIWNNGCQLPVTPSPGPTNTPAVTPTGTPPNLLFADSFESGNTSAWDATSSLTNGDLAVTAGAAQVGSYGMAARINDLEQIYVQDNTPNDETDYRASFWFDPNSFSPSNNYISFDIFRLYETNNEHTMMLALGGHRGTGSGYTLRLTLREDGYSVVRTSWFNISDAPHLVEIYYRTGAVTSGVIDLWLDGSLLGTVQGDNDGRPVDYARLGVVAGLGNDVAGTTGTILLDHFASNTGTSTPVPTNTPSPAPTEANLDFQVRLQGVSGAGPDQSVRVILLQSGQTVATFDQVAVTADAQGVYSGSLTNLGPGSYDFLVKGGSHLQRRFNGINLVVGANQADWTGSQLLAGDANSDNTINIFDVTILSQDFGSRMPAGGSPADFDLDGDVDIFDLVYLSQNFNQSGEQ